MFCFSGCLACSFFRFFSFFFVFFRFFFVFFLFFFFFFCFFVFFFFFFFFCFFFFFFVFVCFCLCVCVLFKRAFHFLSLHARRSASCRRAPFVMLITAVSCFARRRCWDISPCWTNSLLRDDTPHQR